MIHDRSFGVELEVVTSRSQLQIASLITEAGIECLAAGYTHRTHATWKVVSDASIRGGGCEIVSPILVGEDGLSQVARVCDALKAAGCTINSSCGFHVHVDARQIGIAAMRKLAVTYIDFEAVIDSLLPMTRRGNTNSYCRTLTHANKSNLAAADSHQTLANNLGHGRFVKLNFTAFWRHGTVEFRHHSGTVEAQKATNWVLLCLRMVDYAVANPAIEVVRREAQARPILSSEASRRATFVRLLLRPEGATRDEIFAATGWQKGSLSMKRFAAEAGLVLRSSRGRPKRYYGTLRGAEIISVATSSVQTTLSGLADMLDMTADELTYWTGRQRLFAQRNAPQALVA